MKLHKTSKSYNFVNSYSSTSNLSFNFTDEGCYLRVWHACKLECKEKDLTRVWLSTQCPARSQ